MIDVVTSSVFDRPQHLAEAIASVTAQTLKPRKHLISVDHAKVGPGFARNHAAAGADSDWITFLDDDDILYPCHLEELARRQQETGADFVYSEFEYHSALPNPPPNRPPAPMGPVDIPRLWKANYIISPTWLMRTALFRRIGGFLVTYPCEDWFILLEALKAGARFEYTPRVTWLYRGGHLGR